MDMLYTFLISFIFVFLAELGDKTQIIILSFTSKTKFLNILLGIAIGSFLSHGIAIIFGSRISHLGNNSIIFILKTITYITFIILGIHTLFSKRNSTSDSKIIKRLDKNFMSYVFLISLCIMLGEIGDKTFLTSIGLGIKYPSYKISLILGSILGMVLSNFIAILFGKVLEKNISDKYVKFFSGLAFILFGLISLITN